MARRVRCIKLGRDAEGLEHQKVLINENQLNLADKKARDYLAQQIEKYFFGSGAERTDS